MSAETARKALHRQIDYEIMPLLEAALSSGQACRINLYVDGKGKAALPQVKVKPGKSV